MEEKDKISLLKNPEEYFDSLVEKNIISSKLYDSNKMKYSGTFLLYNIIRQLLKDNKEDVVDKILEETNLNEQCSFFKKTPLFDFVDAEMTESYEVFFYLSEKGINISQQNREGDSIFHKLLENFEEQTAEEIMNFIKKFDLSLFEVKNNNGVMPIDKISAYTFKNEFLKESFYALKELSYILENIKIEKDEINKTIEKDGIENVVVNKKRL